MEILRPDLIGTRSDKIHLKKEEGISMKTRRGMVLSALVVIFTMVFAVSVYGEDKSADDMTIVKDAIKANKKLFVSDNMQLTESEAKAFWPVYEKYQDSLEELTDRSIKLIGKYAENYQTMTDEIAKKLLEEFLDIECDNTELKKSYVPKFLKVLPAKKVVRYYQLENKIDAAGNYEIAKEIPIIKY